ncbi:MAG: DinB family protein [Sphingobacterium sp.]
MDNVFKFIIDSRKAFIQLVDQLSLEQLNEIPDGFNNNIIWNFGHIVVSTQTLCYVRTGILPDPSSIEYVSAYAKGTKPDYFVNQAEVDALKRLAIETIETIQKEYKEGRFAQIQAFNTSTFHATLQHIEEVLTTTVGHDNLHYGYAIAQRRIINKNK